MKVGIYFGNTHPASGGGYSFQSEILDGLNSLKSCRHEFVKFTDDTLQQKYLDQHQLNLDPGNKKKQSLLDLAVKDNNLDIVWFLYPGMFQFVNVPFIYTVWDLQHRLQPYFPEVSITGWKWGNREATYRYILPRAARILTGTRQGKKEIMHFYGIAEQNIRVIPFPVPSFPEDGESGINIHEKFGIGDKFLFYPAQFWPHKNHINILRALRVLIDEYGIETELVFTGSDKGNLHYVKKTVNELKLDAFVHFPGFVTRAELKALYQSATALIFASFFGPDNLPPLEAFSLGCPVLASRIPGASEQLGEAALFFDPANPVEMAEIMQKTFRDPDILEELKKRGEDRIKKYPISRYMESFSGMLDEFEAIRACWKNDYRIV